MDGVWIGDLHRAQVLAALWNAAAGHARRLTPQRANAALHAARPALRFEYLEVCFLGVDLAGDVLDPVRYDAHHRPGAAGRSVAVLREDLAPIALPEGRRAAVLAALWNASRGVGCTAGIERAQAPMTEARAAAAIDARRRVGAPLAFDYLDGRVLHADLSGPVLHPAGYDWDLGQGAARRALAALA